jgi:hypothetical protein
LHINLLYTPQVSSTMHTFKVNYILLLQLSKCPEVNWSFILVVSPLRKANSMPQHQNAHSQTRSSGGWFLDKSFSCRALYFHDMFTIQKSHNFTSTYSAKDKMPYDKYLSETGSYQFLHLLENNLHCSLLNIIFLNSMHPSILSRTFWILILSSIILCLSLFSVNYKLDIKSSLFQSKLLEM